MNNVTAAMAIEQLKKLPVFMKKREDVHNFYNEKYAICIKSVQVYARITKKLDSKLIYSF